MNTEGSKNSKLSLKLHNRNNKLETKNKLSSNNDNAVSNYWKSLKRTKSRNRTLKLNDDDESKILPNINSISNSVEHGFKIKNHTSNPKSMFNLHTENNNSSIRENITSNSYLFTDKSIEKSVLDAINYCDSNNNNENLKVN